MATRGKNQPVAQGGFWSGSQPVYSQETQNLLKQMMKESKLTNFQQRQLTSRMAAGQALPQTCNPTTSAKPKREPVIQPQSKVIDPKSHKIEIRTKEQIELSGDLVRPIYEPRPSKNRSEEDKIRLANIMAYGEDVPPPDPKKVRARMLKNKEPEPERFDELVAEIEERRRFLDDMESIGRGKEYRVIIETEISRLIRDMEVLDHKRTQELQRAIAAEEKKRVKEQNAIPQANVS